MLLVRMMKETLWMENVFIQRVKGMEESRGIGVGVMCGRCTCAFLSTYYSYA